MEFWEFLIQREGDRSWLPLESPNVEVLEGRYRLVARTSRVNQPVEIRISHIRLDEQPPRRRTQKRQGQVNGDGLIVVFPFTWLQPGLWELSCAGDLMADMLGQGWRYGVQLSVLQHESEVADDWETDGPTSEGVLARLAGMPPEHAPPSSPPAEVAATAPTPTPIEATPQPLPAISEAAPPAEAAAVPIAPVPLAASESASPVESSPSDVWQKAQADSEAVMDTLLEDLDLEGDAPAIAPAASPLSTETAAADEEDSADEVAIAPPALKPDSLRLVLQQSSLTVQPDQSITLQGTVEPVETLDTPYLPPVALQITLRDPQTAATVLEVRRSLTSRLLPGAFSCQVTLPEPPQTRLLLGEVALVTLATPTNAPIGLASASFTVTASLNELLQAIADDFPSDLYPPLREDEQPVDLDLTFLTTQRATATPFSRPSGQQILPPQLYSPDPNRPRSKGLELPLANLSAAKSEPVSAEAPPEELPPEEAIALEAPSDPPPILDAPDQPQTLDHTLEEADVVLHHLDISEAQAETFPADNLALSAEETAFRALDLQNRFLSRLNALVGDRELSQFLGNCPTPPEEGWDEQEIVADDDVPPPPLRSSIYFQSAPPDPTVEPDTLPAEEPLPTPELRVSTGELVSGQKVEVTVRMPPTAARLGVKLWMQDLQNRALLDGPRWVMNFLPNGQGQLEAWTTMTIPHGCLEVQFEAIAIELSTQRESHKVSLDRPVVPPDLPLLSLDELEI